MKIPTYMLQARSLAASIMIIAIGLFVWFLTNSEMMLCFSAGMSFAFIIDWASRTAFDDDDDTNVG